MESVANIEAPESFTDIQKAEFYAYRASLAEIEKEYLELKDGKNLDQQQCIEQLEEIRRKKLERAEKNFEMRKEMIEANSKKEIEKIEEEKDEYKKILFEKLVRSYNQSYLHITAQLRELLGKEYGQFIAENGIDFPSLQGAETQMKSKMSQPDEAKIRLSPAEAEHDIKYIQQVLREDEE